VFTRSIWFLLLVAAGLAAGFAATYVDQPLHRAETTMVFRRGGVLQTGSGQVLTQLVRSDVVLANVADRLATKGGVAALRPHVFARESNGAVRIFYDGRSAVDAVKVVQQVASIFAVAVQDRLQFTPVVFDPPHADGTVASHPRRDVGIGGLAGLLAGGVVALRRRKRPSEVQADRPAQRQERLPDDGRYRISDLREAVEQGAKTDPARAEDWQAYVAVLASQAEGDFIPHALDGVVRDVFGPLLQS
jgi:hypothetical protein